MLQPRILSRKSLISSQTTLNTLRTYATVADPLKPTTSTGATVSFEPAYSSPPAYRKDENVILRTYKPRTPGIRHLKRPINDHLWKGSPHRPLTFAKVGHGKGGRNHTGRVCVRHRGGGHRRRIRIVDYMRKEPGEHVVERIEYDPNRSAHLALVTDKKKGAEGKKSYIIAAEGMRAGDVVQSYRAGIPADLLKSMGGALDPGMLAAKTAFRGNCLPLHLVPLGTQVYNVGSTKNKGAVFCRSAGTYAIVVGKDDKAGKAFKHVSVRLQSGEVRKVDKDACATIGVSSNPHHHFRQLGKAGRSRWLNIRPTVRGLAMNACDHPHGGGRGKSKGNVHPVSPWGTPAKGGYKTRRKRNINKWVVHERERNQGKRRSGKAA
ncbi:50S ribosomal protein-like protein L2 [Tothia fuscella]|uniref:Large ribosomal subunit protein uL2m n=1 Tax=Tothia fuscella TaxID=1048955 RepID=A0A9P4NYB5_9PEZI|nr:50S ribosomal protein-like protein L2 [Tothia fuscella]